GELFHLAIDALAAAAAVPGLAQEQPRLVQLQVGTRGARDLAVREAAEAREARERHALRDLGIEVELAVLPRADPERRGRGERVAALALGAQAVLAGVGRVEGRLALPDVRGLAADVEAFGRGERESGDEEN